METRWRRERRVAARRTPPSETRYVAARYGTDYDYPYYTRSPPSSSIPRVSVFSAGESASISTTFP